MPRIAAITERKNDMRLLVSIEIKLNLLRIMISPRKMYIEYLSMSRYLYLYLNGKSSATTFEPSRGGSGMRLKKPNERLTRRRKKSGERSNTSDIAKQQNKKGEQK